MTILPIMLQLLLIAMIVFFESYLSQRRQQEENRVQELTSAYKLQNLRNRQASEEDLRQLYHDMKNHLLAINRLSKNGGSIQLNDYINGLLQNFANQEKCVDTGNELLNGLLSEKISEASRDNVEFSVILDFSQITFISDFDLCTIFGNALDNAIEASRMVNDPNDRYISVRGTVAADQMLISISNSYEGIINIMDGIPQTSKPSPTLHGIGISSIRKALQKYGGVMSVDTETKQKFILTIMIPIPKSHDSSE
jgi:sensor histidine kinase regulating citrate/malate metabolism